MPHAVISGPADVVVGQTAGYDGSSSTPIGGLSFAWNVGGVTGSGSTISVKWTSPGPGTATLTVTDTAGQSDTASLAVTVRDNTPSPPPDRDGDGVPDDRDDCPNVPGPASNKGCPTDRDNDGVPDNVDKCPDVAGPASNNGCPPDRDGDGVPDATDKCPDDPGPASNSGCPPDRDGDGVPDSVDKCPDVAGRIVNAGCPDPDRDKDGVPDDEDNCPDVPGPAGPPNYGCPPKGAGQTPAQPKPPVGAPSSTPPAPPAKTQEDKVRWNNLSLELNIASNEFWVLCGVSGGATFIPGIHQLPVGIFTALACTTAGAYGLAAAKYAKWANDPPDPHFTTIPRPATVRLPRIRSSRSVSRRAAAALNAFVRNVAVEGRLVVALTQASERSQGALLAGDTVWAAKQRLAAVTYAAKVVRVIRTRGKLRLRVRAALPASRFPRMSRAGAQRTLRNIRRHGFPKRARRVLATLGLTGSERARLQATVRGLSPRELSLRPFTAILSSRALTKAEEASAEAFARLAASG